MLSYGIVGMGSTVKNGFAVIDMVEKPDPAVAPWRYYLNGRYILQPDIFELLASQEGGAGIDIQLPDTMQRLAAKQPFHAHSYSGRTFDCGSKQGFVEANVTFALLRSDLAPPLAQSLAALLSDHQRIAEIV